MKSFLKLKKDLSYTTANSFHNECKVSLFFLFGLHCILHSFWGVVYRKRANAEKSRCFFFFKINPVIFIGACYVCLSLGKFLCSISYLFCSLICFSMANASETKMSLNKKTISDH